MKKLLLIAVSVLAAVSTYAQGTLFFNTHQVAKGIDAPVTFNGTKVTGPNFVAQLFVGASGSAEGSLVAAGSPTPFLTGAGAGYITIGQVIANNVAPGAAAVVQMRAWDSTSGATYAASATKGASGLLNIAALGGAGSPPSLPADLTGLQAFSVTGAVVPEPSTIALAALGGAAALFLRRRK